MIWPTPARDERDDSPGCLASGLLKLLGFAVLIVAVVAVAAHYIA
ncbi:hypothetical protein [Nonomuraea rubra]|uniref:Uncharacterized protein n=1 Tax=Nonomuraea rubra TaxID=46180 RepID=A0A7X0U5V0_9ACTN|nr:hypothetical protein [Nonomuraea rubra]MBB6556243.1 hypothetical protein [Nonomuraea rubra]